MALSKMCPIDGKIYAHSSTFYEHNNVHKNVLFDCSQCPKNFSTKKYLTQHEVIHNNKSANYECDQCENSFFRKQHLKRHVQSTHEGRLYCCAICGLRFKSKETHKVS